MPQIEITPQALDAIRGAAEQLSAVATRRLPNGNWSIPLEWDTIERLRKHKLEGETFSDAIIRVVALSRGGRQ